MPRFDYKCKECGHIARDFNKPLMEPHPIKCPICKKDALQHFFIGSPHVGLKGKHWKEAGGGRGRF